MPKVFISAGHGGTDPGAIAYGYQEKNLNLAIAVECGRFLQNQGIEICYSRTTDIDDGVNAEAAKANVYGCDLAVSIHCNAGGGEGAEVYYSVVGGTSKMLAENIENSLVSIGMKDRGIKQRIENNVDYFGFIRMTKAAAVIVECGFMDNEKDIKILSSENGQKDLGIAIGRGILKTLNIEEKKQDNKIYRVQIGAFHIKENAEKLLNTLHGLGYTDAFIRADDI